MPALIQPSFAKGEIGPHLYGRVDTAAYQVALRRARNCIIHPWGGVSNRPGTYFLAPQKVHTYAERLIDFQFKTTDTYVLCFGHLYLRFIRNDALITETPRNISTITNANPGVVTMSSNHGWSNGDEVFIEGVVGMTQLNGRWFKIGNVGLATYELYDQETGLVPVNTVSYGVHVGSSSDFASRVYQITTPYTSADLDNIKYTQSNDVMTLSHVSYNVHKLSRTGHTSWTLAVDTFAPIQTFPTAINVVPTVAAAVTYRYKVTAISRDNGEQSLAGTNNITRTITAATIANPAVFTSAAHGYSNGDEIEISNFPGGWLNNGDRLTTTAVVANSYSLIRADGTLVDSTTFPAFTTGNTKQTDKRITNGAATANNTISWTAAAGAERYFVYKFDNGAFGWIGETTALQFLDDNIQANLARTPPTSNNPFMGSGAQPGATGYWEQRQVYGGSLNGPDQSDYSQVGLHSNFSRSSPLQEDDAFSASFNAGQVNDIRHYVPLNDLIVFTSGAEFKINSGNDTAFSANSIKQKRQSSWGCSHLRPQVVGNTIIYAEDSKARVRSFGFSFQIDGYAGVELSLLAPHLMETSPIYDWAFSNAPEPRLYMARADGRAMTMTFDQEQEVVGWTPWETKGSYERMCVLRNPSTEASRENGVYFVVKRRVNGKTVRYIEKQASRVFQDIRDAYFVDCGLSVDNPMTIENINFTNPAQFTITGHGMANGTEIEPSDIIFEPIVDDMFNETQPDQFNYKRYIIGNVTANTFDLFDSDGNPIDATAFNIRRDGGVVRKTFQIVSGYDHIEGMRVSVLADGNVVSGKTIVNGSLTLPQRAVRAHIGLGYISDIETLSMEASSGTIQGVLKSIAGAVFRFKQTRGVLMGPSADLLEQWDQRQDELYGAPTDDFSGDHEQVFRPDWKVDGHVLIRQPYPLPVTLLSAVPKFELGG